MQLNFDLEPDELPIFIAETDEQLQVLDEGLIQLEHEGENNELLQSLFRAAHTLKGTSGMIGHKRMVTVTHALETVLDGLRKNQYPVTSHLIDVCLEASDGLRHLRGEVLTRETSDVEVDEISNHLSKAASVLPTEVKGSTDKKISAELDNFRSSTESRDGYIIEAIISSNSIASAARAFQIILALQDMGTITHMEPSMEEIETAKPVHHYLAHLDSDEPAEKILKVVGVIAEIDSISVHPVSEQPQPVSPELQSPSPLSVPETNKETPTASDSERGKPAATSESSGNAPASSQANKPVTVEKTVRTSVERLDNLMNLVGELITDRNRLYQIRNKLEARFRSDGEVDVLGETIAHIGRITDQLQMEVMSIRMLPVSNVFNKFPRMVRDLSNKFNKKVDLVIHGEDTELDRSVIEEITDPLIHLIRNSVDHGIEDPQTRKESGKPERATILLTASHEQGRIILTVQDDGRGIDTEKVKNAAVSRGYLSESVAASMSDDEAINLIFASGLSTAKKVSDISGRGVGLDIVRNNIQRLSGSIVVETWKGKGSKFQIILPLTLAIVPTLLVKVGGSIFAIPLVTVVETLRVAESEIKTIARHPVITIRNKVLPLVDLIDVFNHFTVSENTTDYKYVVVVGSGKQEIGLIVDNLVGQEEVVVKSLGLLIGDVQGIASAAILGDGQVILILDIQDLFQMTTMH